MAEPTSLENVLNEPAPAEAPPAAPVEKPGSIKQEWRDKEQGAQGRVRNPETGQYSPKEEVKVDPKVELKVEAKVEPKVEPKPAEEFSAREKAAFAKAADETRKRQALERQLAEVKKEPQKPFYEDPDGALAKQKAELEGKLELAIMTTKVQTSESIARSRYPDYDEKFSIFNELVQKSPYLAEQAFQSPDPAEFAYHTAKTEKDLREAGGVDNLRKKMEEEIRTKVRAEIEAELKRKQETLEKEREALPGSLSETPSKGSNRSVWSGPTSLENILKS